MFTDKLTGRPWTSTVREFWNDLQKGEVSIIRSGVESPLNQLKQKHPQLVFTWDSIPEKHRELINLKLAYIKEVERLNIGVGQRQEMGKVIRTVSSKINDPAPPSTSALMGWYRRYLAGGKAPAALLSFDAYRIKTPRLSADTIAFIDKTLRTYYCSRERHSLLQTTDFINKQLKLQTPAGSKPPEVSHSTVNRRLQEIDAYKVDESRYGVAYARNKYRNSERGVNQQRAQQRYEIDHTLIDLVVVCDRSGMPLGRPTITVVVDSFSGYVVSFFLSFWGTGLAPTFGALKLAFGIKPDYQALVEGLINPWYGSGICEHLLCDNGLEFHSPQLLVVARYLSFGLSFCPVRQPWLKPMVERVIGHLTRRLPHAGMVHKSLKNEIPVAGDKTAAITFSDLSIGLLKLFVDEHAMKIHQRHLTRPLDLFTNSLAEHPPSALPIPSSELDIVVAPSTSTTVNHEGVVMQGLRYSSDELRLLRKKLGTKFKTTVKFDIQDMSHVWLQDPSSKGWLEVPSCNPEYTQNLSLIQHKAIKKLARDQNRERGHVEAYARAKNNLIDHWNSAIKHGRRIKSEHLRALSPLTSSRSILGEPVMTVEPLTVLNSHPSAIACAELPVFASFQMGGE